MKKLLLLLLIAPMFGNSQIPSGLELTDIISVNPYYDGQLTVPNGKVWYIRLFGNDSARGYKFFPEKNDPSSETQGILLGVNNNDEGIQSLPLLHPAGTIIDYAYEDFSAFYIYEFTTLGNDFNNSLSFEEQSDFTPTLYPNPTSSLLALNSDKEYDIEVYDMAGNKVMALKGNTIDMSHLSSATYIVKALDKVENEEVSYKVVKN
ncbi:MAG: T9SS type A sorting domain-containing protein [Flavobacteriaceae bacterium]|nr:T9SS type A sorting domain-containing protein [Flavobacteriaceae bacterium]